MSVEGSAVLAAEIPHGWTAVAPTTPGVAGAQLAAVRDLNTSDPVVTSFAAATYALTVRPDLAGIADEAIRDLGAGFDVKVIAGDSAQTETMSEFNQLLEMSCPVGNLTVELRQIRILIAAAAPEGFNVLQLVLTSPVETFPEASREFREFVATIVPARAHDHGLAVSRAAAPTAAPATASPAPPLTVSSPPAPNTALPPAKPALPTEVGRAAPFPASQPLEG